MGFVIAVDPGEAYRTCRELRRDWSSTKGLLALKYTLYPPVYSK
jgi:hypothetical protein